MEYRCLTEEDRTLVDVAADAGVYIPTLCYLKDKPCLGTCRVCSVKVNGAVVAACTVRVSDGLKVEVDEPETADIRKALVELLFVEGNHNCPSCEKSGRCTLQAVGYEVDMLVSRFPYRFPHTRAGPRLGQDMAGAGSLHLLPTLRGIRPRRSHRPEDLQHQPPRPRVPGSKSTPNAPTPCRSSRSAMPSRSAPSAPFSRNGSDTTCRSAGASTKSNPSGNGHWTSQTIPAHRDRRNRIARNALNATGSGAHGGPRGQDQRGDDRVVRLLGMHLVVSRHGRADPVRS